ncbi:MAG: molecular chaperone HtpG [Ignavibacteria bacterium GWB2_35_12]|nr:MAG: molecular chaperone HtpG [Ignavibacteria bacterium GWA2_35_8]OGU39848.1 MAG: molecular chaperone HtpG [Ignavibacteria bacterium GWB2_35_12]OGU90036.1 MAG: molecular chaperone HtpG [Ignavibacteria bacterium RIFOXYA2_FULL_35_10]OGV21491.1 MAG: molecular chaperone HtpG [Ignavibacteria bacterium RIFOXYC2_FULL_35_21]
MTSDEVKAKNEFEYKAEMKQLLHLIVHSLYTHPEVFLRELISNSSDALNKIRFRRLTDSNILDPDSELKINIDIDEKENTFSITDTGIGMTKEDLIGRIGTIASSGTLEFFKKMEEENKSLDANLIGQFGVGFYSVFMVTDEINIETTYAVPNSKTYLWKSFGEDKFTVEEIENKPRGTKISFKLKDEYKEFAQPWKVKSILKKYSNFVDFPVYVNAEKVNIVSALWHRKKEDIKDEELNDFYTFISNDSTPPMAHLLLNIEGILNFRALIFIPETAPPSLFQDALEKSLQLYSNRIFIQDNCKELIPDYLKFVKGVVDTEELPLNVSREVTQSSPVITKIKNVLVSKILAQLEDWAENAQAKYEKFYNNFGSLLKTGINADFTHKVQLIELLRYETSLRPKGEKVSLKEYVQRMAEGQKEIYYIMGDHRDLIEMNPNLEYFRKNELEVLYLTDPVDVFTIPYIFEYDKKQLKSIEKADIDIKKVNKEEKSSDTSNKGLLDYFKEVLGDKVEDVIESNRLVDSAVTLVVGKQGFDPQVEKMMQYIDKNFTHSKRILEVNTSHNIIRNINSLFIANSNPELVNNAILQLYEGALLLEGKLPSPNEFLKRMNEFIELSTKSKNVGEVS